MMKIRMQRRVQATINYEIRLIRKNKSIHQEEFWRIWVGSEISLDSCDYCDQTCYVYVELSKQYCK